MARAIRDCLGRLQIGTRYIAPGSPRENGYAESFHSKLVDEFLSRQTFESVTAARRFTTPWKDDDNHHRPHSGIAQPEPS